jgi:hypothetical protein
MKALLIILMFMFVAKLHLKWNKEAGETATSKNVEEVHYDIEERTHTLSQRWEVTTTCEPDEDMQEHHPKPRDIKAEYREWIRNIREVDRVRCLLHS